VDDMIGKQKSVKVLLSGGIDSSACIHYYQQDHHDVTGVFIDFGQKTVKYELSRVFFSTLLLMNFRILINNN
jgi:7-cyano-7-deazaguanine synthase in queuosine biosynthesis